MINITNITLVVTSINNDLTIGKRLCFHEFGFANCNNNNFVVFYDIRKISGS